MFASIFNHLFCYIILEAKKMYLMFNQQLFLFTADAPLIPVQGYSRRSQHEPYVEGYNERQQCEMQLRYPTPGNVKAWQV